MFNTLTTENTLFNPPYSQAEKRLTVEKDVQDVSCLEKLKSKIAKGTHSIRSELRFNGIKSFCDINLKNKTKKHLGVML
jgi:hypothetical protein